MKKRWLFVIPAVLIAILMISTPAYAIDLPDSTPAIISKNCYRNVVETGDLLVIIYENTPYATTPDIDYSDAFIWRLIDTDGTTELGQALGYDYNDDGYGYNVIGFYFSTDDAPTWEQSYHITLSGTPSAFTSPPEYNYQLDASDYSSLTDTTDVKAAITALILNLAQDLDNKWGLTSDTSLLLEIETGTVLSMYGEAFFRGALYGLQAMAPDAFRLIIGSVNVEDRAWDPAYSVNLTTQHSGTDIGTAMDAGELFFDVDYNLMGILGTLAICVVLIALNWYIAGGNIWKGLIESAAVLVIAGRLGLFGLGEVALVAAICWLYVDAKLWKIV